MYLRIVIMNVSTNIYNSIAKVTNKTLLLLLLLFYVLPISGSVRQNINYKCSVVRQNINITIRSITTVLLLLGGANLNRVNGAYSITSPRGFVGLNYYYNGIGVGGPNDPSVLFITRFVNNHKKY